jgi:RNA polymerase sigma-70 factor, ECF subfamily
MKAAELGSTSVDPLAPPVPDEEKHALIRRAIERFQRHDDREAAFRLIFETYAQVVTRFFANKGLRPEDCHDLTQETFLGIYRGLDGYEDQERFPAWLFRVATTTFLKFLRSGSTGKRKALEVPFDDQTQEGVGLVTAGRQLEGLLDEERRRRVVAAVAELPGQMRDCLTLRLCRNLAYREIALLKRLSVETVKAHLMRARRRLSEQLGDDDLGDFADRGAALRKEK